MGHRCELPSLLNLYQVQKINNLYLIKASWENLL